MNCRRAKALIFDFIDGMVGDKDRATLEQHLSECETCESTAKSLSKSLDLLHDLPQIQPSENFNWKVRLGIAKARNALANDVTTERSWLRSWNIRFAMSAAATLVVVAGSGYFLMKTSVIPDAVRMTSMPVASEVAKKSNPSPAVDRPTETVRYDPTLPGSAPFVSRGRTGSPSVGQELVSTVGRDAAAQSDPLIGEVKLNADSLTDYFQRSRSSEFLQQDRVWRLEQQINALQGELYDCSTEDK